MVCSKLPKHERVLIVEMYQPGEGYKLISKASDMQLNTVNMVVINWRKCGTKLTLLRTGCLSRIDEKPRKTLSGRLPRGLEQY